MSAPHFGFKISFSFLYYILDAGLMTSNIVPKIFIRVFWLLSTFVLVFTEELKEDKAIAPKAVMFIIGAAIIEVIIFAQLKMQVKFFLQDKVTKL